MTIVVYLLLIISLALSAYYSIRARRQTDPVKRGLFFARMNIMMGVLLTTMALSQMFFAPYRFWLLAFAILVLLIGLYNLFVGIRNHGTFTRMLK